MVENNIDLSQETTDIAVSNGYDKMNTFELLDTYLDKHLDHQMINKENIEPGDWDNDLDKLEELEKELEVIEKYMLKKVENIEHVMIRKDLALAQVKSAEGVYKKHLDFLRNKRRTIEGAWTNLETLIITLVEGFGEEKKNGHVSLNKDSITYTVYQSPGSLEIQNDEEIPDRYLKLSTKLDRARLRKDIIKDGNTDYASVPKVKRLKIK